MTSLAGGVVPKPGNWTICLSCCAVLRFTDNSLGVRAINEMERMQLESGPDWPEFQRVISAVKEMWGKSRHR